MMICGRLHKRRLFLRWSVLLSLAFPVSGRSVAGDTHPGSFSIENPRYQSMVVARVGSHQITAQEFLLNYAFGPAFPKREKQSKTEYLKYMIYEKLLALDGYRHQIDKTEDARLSLAEMQGDLATEELYKHDILSKIHVTEKAIQLGISQDHVSCSVRWIYTRTPEEMEGALVGLAHGISFDSLYRLQFRDTSVKADDRSMVMSRFRIGMHNPQLARVLDTLHIHHLSAPIQTPDGYYLVYLADAERDVMVNQSEEIKQHEDVKRALIQHLADSLSDRYVQKLVTDHHPSIERRTIDILHAHFAKVMLSASDFDSWRLVPRLLDRWGPVEYERVDPSLVLVTSRGIKFTSGDFLNWYRAREVNLKFTLTTPEAMFASLEGYVWQMVRDRLLTVRAYQRGYQHLPRVKEQLAWWKDKIVYNIIKAGLEDSIHPTNTALQEYYREHERDFRDTSGVVIPFNNAKEDVLRAWFSFELTKATVHRVLKLKEEYHISINDQILDQLTVDSENDPRAIDVYVAKPGGIFPRPAFPTIDYSWQTWN